MSGWLNDAWAYLRSLTAGFDLPSVLSFLGRKLLEGLFQAAAVVVIGWLVLYRQWRQLTQGKSDQVDLFSKPFHTARCARSTLSGWRCGICFSFEPCLHPKRSISFWTTWRCGDKCGTWPNRPPWSTRSSLPRELPVSRSSTTLSIAFREAWRRHPFGAINGSWHLRARIGGSSVNVAFEYSLSGAADLERLESWEWCRTHILVEAWYHYWRIVTLHQIALRFREEQAKQEQGSASDIKANLLPLVDRQAHHPRIRILSLGLNVEEPIIKPPIPVDWERYLPQVAEMGLKLPDATVQAHGT